MPSPLQRQIYLVSLLKKRNYSKDDLIDKIVGYFDLESYSESSFERDKKEIGSNSHLPSLKYHRHNEVYQLNPEDLYLLDESEVFSRLMENEFLLSSVNKNGLISDKIIFESRKFTGTEWLQDLKKAIDSQQEISFDYFYYDTQETKSKTVKAYRLKLKDFRWYLLAKDDSDVPFKSYGLERISNLSILERKFATEEIDFEAPYSNAFGMFTDGGAQKIVLQFDSRDGNYLQTNPIHPSQITTSLSDGNVQIDLYVKPTLDLIMELMKRTWSLKIVEPSSLRETFIGYWQEALERNKSI